MRSMVEGHQPLGRTTDAGSAPPPALPVPLPLQGRNYTSASNRSASWSTIVPPSCSASMIVTAF